MHVEQEENVESILGKQQAKCNMHRRSGYKGNNNKVIVASFVALLIAVVGASPNKDVQPAVRINKCCEKFEIYVENRCEMAADVNASELRGLEGDGS
jgi:hypothetical protein